MAEMKANLALTVSNLERSRAFYEALLDVSPNKVRPGYEDVEHGEHGRSDDITVAPACC